MKLNKKLIILSIVGLVLIGIIAGGSFAYFSVTNSEGSENTVKSGTMALLFTDGPQITANNLAPGEYVEKTFKVKNTGNVDTRYDVYFSEVLNTFVDKTDLVYTLVSNDGGYNTTNEVQVPDEEAKIVNQQLITPNEEHTYTLRITFKLKQTIQNVNMGRTFSAKININEFNLNSGEHLLKLIDASGDEVDKQILATNQENYTLALNNTDLTNSTNIYCNNGGIPTISGNTLNVSGVTNDTVCTISNDIVDTVNNKLRTNKTGIVMTNNQNGITRMSIPSTKEVILDLNGKNINGITINSDDVTWNLEHCGFLLDGSILTVNDSKGSGGIYIGKDARVFYVIKDSNLVINGGSYNGRQAIGVEGAGNNLVVINDGIFNSNYYNTILTSSNSSDLIINNGHFSSVHDIVNITNNGHVEINGGVFTASLNKYAIINNYGVCDITSNGNPVYFTGTKDNAPIISNGSNSVLNINATKADNCTNDYHDTHSGLCLFTDTEESRTTIGIGNDGKININGGTYITRERGINIYSDASTNAVYYIKNAEFYSKYVAAQITGPNGVMNFCNSVVSGLEKDVCFRSSATINYSSSVIFSDGTNNPTLYASGSETLYRTEDACTWPSN